MALKVWSSMILAGDTLVSTEKSLTSGERRESNLGYVKFRVPNGHPIGPAKKTLLHQQP